MAVTSQMTVSNAFYWMKSFFFNFDSNFTEVFFQWSNWQFCSIDSVNGLALDRGQAITCTNIHRRIYAELGKDELDKSG